MQIEKKSRRQKILVTLSATGFLILILLVLRIEPSRVSAELLFKTEMIETIKNEVAEVRSTREDYFAEIGYGNSGAYDQYQIDSDCVEDLGQRLSALKNLRNDFKRMIAVTDFHFGKQQIDSRARAIESLMARVSGDTSGVTLEKSIAEIGLDEATKTKLDELEAEIAKIKNEVLSEEELAVIQKNESAKQAKFNQATKEFENCAQIYKKLENCKAELSKWFTARDEYQVLVLELENLSFEKEQEITARLKPVEAEIDALLNSNQ